MQSVHAPSPGLRALGEVAGALAALGRLADGLALASLARLGALLVGLPVLRRRYVTPLHRRSRALRGATVKLHRISPARDPRGARERARLPRSFHWLEVTIRPRRTRRAPAWRPQDLALVGAAARPGRPEQDDAVGRIHGVARWRNGYWVEHGVYPELVGPQRLRLLVAVTPGTRHFRFRYYLELLRREPRRSASGTPPRSPRRSASGDRGPSAARREVRREGDPRGRRTIRHGLVSSSLLALATALGLAASASRASPSAALPLANPGIETGDGGEVDSHDFASIDGVDRATPCAVVRAAAAGSYEVQVPALPSFFAGPGTPRQHIDNVVGTPEPSTLCLALPARSGPVVARRCGRRYAVPSPARLGAVPATA